RSQRPPDQDKAARRYAGRTGAAPEGTRRLDQRVPPDRLDDSLNLQVRPVHDIIEVVHGSSASSAATGTRTRGRLILRAYHQRTNIYWTASGQPGFLDLPTRLPAPSDML